MNICTLSTVKFKVCLLLVLICPLALRAFSAEQSLVEIEITKKTYNYRQPWLINNQTGTKNGIIIDSQKILTTADGLTSDATCRIRKGGESSQINAKIHSIDYEANIALLEVDDVKFWKSVKAVRLAKKLPQAGELQIFRWRSGRIEERAAEIIRLDVGNAKLSNLNHLVLLASSEINSAGWAEIVMKGNYLVGLTTAGSKSKMLSILPSTVIQQALKRGACNQGPGHGFFDFFWTETSNPALPASKGLNLEKEQGVLITQTGIIYDAAGELKEGDIVLTIDGFDIDSEGKYIDPLYGRLSLEGLCSRNHHAGEQIPMRIWRDLQVMEINYTLPRSDFTRGLIPNFQHNQTPKYIIAGGCVFQPLNNSLIRSLGDSASGMMNYYAKGRTIPGRTSLVALTTVLPDDYNLNFENLGPFILDSINGVKIETLEDVSNALAQPPNGYHKIKFMSDEYLQHIVLDAETLATATERILENYRIPAAASL